MARTSPSATNVYVLDRPFAATAKKASRSKRLQHRGQATFKFYLDAYMSLVPLHFEKILFEFLKISHQNCLADILVSRSQSSFRDT